MRFLQPIVFIIVVFVPSVWATGAQLALKVPPGDQETGKALDQVRQQQSRSQTEVTRLEHDVIRQQSNSDEADKRLQEQDKAIAELQKQLRELKARPRAAQH